MKLTFDLETMTLGEVEDFETASGLTFEELMEGRRTPRSIAALIYIQERRKNPSYTMDDARSVRITDLEVSDVESEPDPTPAGDAS